jgi:hypothetical protein
LNIDSPLTPQGASALSSPRTAASPWGLLCGWRQRRRSLLLYLLQQTDCPQKAPTIFRGMSIYAQPQRNPPRSPKNTLLCKPYPRPSTSSSREAPPRHPRDLIYSGGARWRYCWGIGGCRCRWWHGRCIGQQLCKLCIWSRSAGHGQHPWVNATWRCS